MNDVQRKYNLKSPGVKRLMREAAELREPTEQYYAQPLEDNLFEWHFTVRGPADTEFSEGKYHGRITLPPEYPMKPPSIILLTPNGRFELGKKICLSMSAHHPETWQPSWSIRTVLLALIGFMPSQGAGAIGSLDYTPEERKVLAKKSQTWKCETCSMDHSDCLLEVNPEKDTSGEMDEAKELAAQISFKGEAEKGTATKPTNEVPNPQQGAALQFQREFQQFMQNMQQPGFPGNFQFPLPPMQQNNFQNIPPVNNSASSNNAQPAATTGPVTTQTTTPRPTTTPASDSNIRQRNVNQINTENVNTNINSTTSQPRATELNTRRSFLDTITLWLLYIVTFLLVALIIRRLALEKTGITKD